MKFELNDFLELDTKALLTVNGGTDCSSSPSGGWTNSNDSDSSDGPSGGNTPNGGGGSSGGSSSGGSGGSCGGSSNPKGGNNTPHGGPDGKPAYGPDGTPISYEPGYTEPSNGAGNCGGSCGGNDKKNPQDGTDKSGPKTTPLHTNPDGTTTILVQNPDGTGYIVDVDSNGHEVGEKHPYAPYGGNGTGGNGTGGNGTGDNGTGTGDSSTDDTTTTPDNDDSTEGTTQEGSGPGSFTAPTTGTTTTTGGSHGGGSSTPANTETPDTPETPDAPTVVETGSFAQITDGSYADNLTMQYYKNGMIEIRPFGFGETLEMAKMHDLEMNGGYKFSEAGCKMTGTAKIVSEVTGKVYYLTDINKKVDSNRNGELTVDEITSGLNSILDNQYGDIYEVKGETIDNPTLNNLQDIASDTSGTTYVLGKAADVHGSEHWVVLEGYTVKSDGSITFNYDGTSDNDARKNRSYVIGTSDTDNNIHNIVQIQAITIYQK